MTSTISGYQISVLVGYCFWRFTGTCSLFSCIIHGAASVEWMFNDFAEDCSKLVHTGDAVKSLSH